MRYNLQTGKGQAPIWDLSPASTGHQKLECELHPVEAHKASIKMAYILVFKQKLNGFDVINRFNYEDDGIPTRITAGQIADQVVADWTTHLVPFLSAQWSLEEVTWTHTNAPVSQPAETLSVTALPLVGAATGFSTANQVAMYVRSKTIDGPPFAGGAYLGGWNSSLVGSDGLINQNRLDAAKDFMDAIMTVAAVSIGNVARVIVSGGTDTVTKGTEALVNVNLPSARPSTLDKRRIGRGS